MGTNGVHRLSDQVLRVGEVAWAYTTIKPMQILMLDALGIGAFDTRLYTKVYM